MNKKLIFGFVVIMLSILACAGEPEPPEIPDRESLIPFDQEKITPETDIHPPVMLSDEFEAPIPMPYPVNTRGAEDSSFILPDGNTLYVWFTPDTKMAVHAQAVDLVTGIYVFYKVNGQWTPPERVWLIEPGKPVLDGCGFILGNKMWFCTVREGYTGIHWATAELKDGKWQNWQVDDFPEAYEVGELHISNDGTELYFHSHRAGGKGGMDIWMSKNVNGEWQPPENLVNVNSEYDEGWPALSPDGNELWISKNFGLWRSKKVGGVWQAPEEIISTLAGEATIDQQGNVYFTHHFYKDDVMLEADIYVAMRK